MFALAAVSISTHHTPIPGGDRYRQPAVGDLLPRPHETVELGPAAVAAYIGTGYFFTSSASFANPAISVGRMFSDTFASGQPS
jgi:hypothetical protein